MFWWSWYRKDNGIIDVQWGLSFIEANLTVLFTRIYYGGLENNLDPRVIILNILIFIWGLRMTIHIFLRLRKGSEDRRFAALREKMSPVVHFCVSLFGVWLGNAFFIILINSSALYISMYSSKEIPLCYLDYIGILIWLVGFCFLAVADHQGRVFKNKREAEMTNGERLCKTGLWKYSRHPNYFGEAVLWWGIYIMACSVTTTNGDRGWITIWSPVLIFVLLRFISGVPLVEDLYKDSEEFKQWAKVTNVLVPFVPKKDQSLQKYQII